MPHLAHAPLAALLVALLSQGFASSASADPATSAQDLVRAYPGRLDGALASPDFARMGEYLLGVNDQLFVIDASDPRQPRLVESFRPADAGRIDSVEVAGRTAWLGGDRLIAIDMSDPRAPFETARFTPRFRTDDMALGVVGGRVLLVLRNGQLFEVLDVTDPDGPFYRGDFRGDAFARFRFVGDRVILSSSLLEMYDLADPDSPVRLGQLTIDGGTLSLDVHGDVAFIASDSNGLALVDISDPTDPSVIGRHPAGSAHFVRATGGVALLGTASAPDDLVVQVLDVRDPATISLLRSYPATWMRDAAIFGRYALMADALSLGQPNTVTTLDLSHPGGTPVLGEPWQASAVMEPDFATRGRHAFVAVSGRPWMLTVLGYPDAAGEPEAVAIVNPLQIVERMEVAGDLLVLQTIDGFEIWSIADPTRPVWLSSTQVGDTPRWLAVSGGLVFTIVGCGAGLQIYDIAVPSSPVLLSDTNLTCHSRIDVAGQILLARSGRSLRVVDASDPTAPIDAGEYRSDLTIDAVLAYDHPTLGPLAYVATAARLVTVGLAHPANPVVLFESSALYPGDSMSLHRRGDILVVNPTDRREKYLVDISDPTATRLLGTLFDRGAIDIEWLDDSMLLSGPGNSIRRLGFRSPESCDADLDGNGRLDVFDFLEFINRYHAGDPASDYDADGQFTLMDFLAYQTLFAGGC